MSQNLQSTDTVHVHVHACELRRPAKRAVFISEDGEGVREQNERCSFQGRLKPFATLCPKPIMLIIIIRGKGEGKGERDRGKGPGKGEREICILLVSKVYLFS